MTTVKLMSVEEVCIEEMLHRGQMKQVRYTYNRVVQVQKVKYLQRFITFFKIIISTV